MTNILRKLKWSNDSCYNSNFTFLRNINKPKYSFVVSLVAFNYKCPIELQLVLPAHVWSQLFFSLKLFRFPLQPP